MRSIARNSDSGTGCLVAVNSGLTMLQMAPFSWRVIRGLTDQTGAHGQLQMRLGGVTDFSVGRFRLNAQQNSALPARKFRFNFLSRLPKRLLIGFRA